MRKHPLLAGLMVSKIGFLEKSMPILLYHHERYDGGGYPFGLAGESIPLEARIFSIVDAYDAMTSDRPYRDAMTHEAAMAEIDANGRRAVRPGRGRRVREADGGAAGAAEHDAAPDAAGARRARSVAGDRRGRGVGGCGRRQSALSCQVPIRRIRCASRDAGAVRADRVRHRCREISRGRRRRLRRGSWCRAAAPSASFEPGLRADDEVVRLLRDAARDGAAVALDQRLRRRRARSARAGR